MNIDRGNNMGKIYQLRPPKHESEPVTRVVDLTIGQDVSAPEVAARADASFDVARDSSIAKLDTSDTTETETPEADNVVTLFPDLPDTPVR